MADSASIGTRGSSSRRASAIYWGLVGALVAFGAAALLTVGIFVLAGAAVLILLAMALKLNTRTLPAALIGAACIPFYIAIINYNGPGVTCTRTATSISCGEQLNPWPFVAVGIALLALGVIMLRAARRRADRVVLEDPPYPPLAPRD